MYVHGTFNVAKCCRYLRAIGVEISEQQEAEWRDAEKVGRWLRKVRARGYDITCLKCGESWYEEHRRGQRHKKGGRRCPECGGNYLGIGTRFIEYADGRIKDYRDKGERWRPLRESKEQP